MKRAHTRSERLWQGVCRGFRPGPRKRRTGLSTFGADAYVSDMTELSRIPIDALSLDEAARPKAPPVPGATDLHRRQGRQLAAIHRHYLMELGRVEAVLARIEAGDAPPEELRQIVLSLDMGENLRAVGNICGRQCMVLKFHHDIEERQMFPDIEGAAGAGFAAVVAKLRAEHEVVHELLGRLERAAAALVREPTEARFAEAAAVFRKLRAVIGSHFGYEETELAEAIGYYLGGV